MRKLILVALISTLPLAGATHAFGGPDDQEPGKHFEMMAKKLDLSDEQKGEVARVFADHREKMMALRDETQQKLDTILTEEQREKLNAMHEKRRQKMKERMSERH